jgi:hypothetical protein
MSTEAKRREVERMREFLSLPLDMQKDILREQGIVSTITHTPKQVARHFVKWRKKNQPQQVSVRQRVAAVGNDLRSQAFSLFDQGCTAAQVAKQFMITYGNSHYYYRQWKKQQ